MICTIQSKEVNFSELRNVCTVMNQENDTKFPVNASDQELWKSVCQFFRDLL